MINGRMTGRVTSKTNCLLVLSNKYKYQRDVFLQFGELQKLRLVRILRSTVMVRVGGGWQALDEFLQKNDPCRSKLDSFWIVLSLKLY